VKNTEVYAAAGLTESEGHIYAAALHGGKMTLSQLSRASGIGKTTLYPHIDSLLRQGLLVKTIVGKRAYQNTGSNVTALGYASAYQNTGSYVSALGYASAQQNTGSNVTASGIYSAYQNTGSNVTALGYASAQQNTGSNVTALGYASAYQNTGSNNTGNGYQTLYRNSGSNNLALGYNTFNVTPVAGTPLTVTAVNTTTNLFTVSAPHGYTIGSSTLMQVGGTAAPGGLTLNSW
jgi:hypothetical protein